MDIHKGRWQLKRHPHNTASVHFWNHVISEFTNHNFELVESYHETEYDDGTLGDIFFFHS